MNEILQQISSASVNIKSIITCVVGIGVGILFHWWITKFFGANAKKYADNLKEEAKKEAEHIIREAKVAAKSEFLKLKDEFEKETKEKKQEIITLEKRIAAREEHLEKRADILDARAASIEKEEKEINNIKEKLIQKENELKQQITAQIKELEKIAELSKEAAKELLLEKVKGEVRNEMGHLIRSEVEEAKNKSDKEAQKILVYAMQRYAGECAYEHTTSTVHLPSDEMKGRIIGRDGRNIRVIESVTGVTLLVDDTPEAVVLSCFEPVRREKARLLLEKLISDGRIHPTRIEELYRKIDKEVEGEIIEAGEEAILEVGVTNIPEPVVKLLGRLKYRYSFTQNVLRHSIEAAHFMGVIASELKLDSLKAKKIGLLHDIGKALDSEMEGTHAMLGAELLKKYNEDPEVINAIASHHEEVEKNTIYAVLACIADAMSASRPGARSETAEFYLKRLEKLEEIASSFNGVESCYAVQAGREARVIVNPEKINDNEAMVLARDICKKIESEMNYPGQIKVTVIRETRSVEYAK
ncbi:MAG TPA: ribonuclease Y [Victivallales bacterium]|nr:ribonuclease Y [Victivallales bacterium]HPO89802.1 ribonuclease Y [Victivallales bacterium]HRR27963.1 ribonuclease Y [Victivallales bacterium]